MTQPDPTISTQNPAPAFDPDRWFLDRLRDFGVTVPPNMTADQALGALLESNEFVNSLPPEIQSPEQVREAWQVAQERQAAPAATPAAQVQTPSDPYAALQIDPITYQVCKFENGAWVPNSPQAKLYADNANAILAEKARRGQTMIEKPKEFFAGILEEKLAELDKKYQAQIEQLTKFRETEVFQRAVAPVQDLLFTRDPVGQFVPTEAGERFTRFVDMAVKAGMSKDQAAAEAITILNLTPQPQSVVATQTDTTAATATGEQSAPAAPAATPSAPAPTSAPSKPLASKKDRFIETARQSPHAPASNASAAAAVKFDPPDSPNAEPSIRQLYEQASNGALQTN